MMPGFDVLPVVQDFSFGVSGDEISRKYRARRFRYGHGQRAPAQCQIPPCLAMAHGTLPVSRAELLECVI